MRYLFIWLLAGQFFWSALPAAEAHNTPPALTAGAAVLMDSHTGDVLYSKNAAQMLAPASTTKIMTAILAIESGRLQENAVISQNAAQTGGSTLQLKAGQTYSVEDLLTGLLMRSGNDCAVAIAETIAGSTEAFVAQMNSKAAQLGALDTHFKNPHGLPDPEHRSTAYDLAWITRYALRMPVFSTIVNTRKASIDFQDTRGQQHDRELENTNKLLWLLPEADGVKTGTTSEAGPCLVSSATKNGWQLIAVILNDKKRWQDSQSLLTWGFENFTLYDYAAAGETIETLPVSGGTAKNVAVTTTEAAAMVVEKAKLQQIKPELELPEKITAPVYQGQKIGSLKLIADGAVLKEFDLQAAESIEENSISRFLLNQLSLLWRFFAQLGII